MHVCNNSSEFYTKTRHSLICMIACLAFMTLYDDLWLHKHFHSNMTTTQTTHKHTLESWLRNFPPSFKDLNYPHFQTYFFPRSSNNDLRIPALIFHSIPTSSCWPTLFQALRNNFVSLPWDDLSLSVHLFVSQLLGGATFVSFCLLANRANCSWYW